ncbi:MAG: dTDP-4-dehydrorhamnose 3,5-epimerase [Spartobacteria bacterium]|nr:dTDP-4-dehydrorhamnose 3,5-epimerase [Spartobacteria bacterium]
MNVISLAIPEVKLLTPRRFGDHRGFFQQTYVARDYADHGIDAVFIQDNWSRSCSGTLRGLHYQLKHAQAKLVSVIRGSVFDVAVDIRVGSPTFGQSVGAELSEENASQLFVPRGFAHGFLVLSETVDFMYKCDNYYTPGDEYGIRWNDPALHLTWPSILVDPILSDKDLITPFLNDVPENLLPKYEAGEK